MLLKNSLVGSSQTAALSLIDRTFMRWPCHLYSWFFALAHEAYQAFYVLNRCGEEELLFGSRQTAQTQFTEANLIA
jgi:hypothetical protein